MPDALETPLLNVANKVSNEFASAVDRLNQPQIVNFVFGVCKKLNVPVVPH
jgi:hypothetical protein